MCGLTDEYVRGWINILLDILMYGLVGGLSNGG
jgi:hypothetical protein